MKRKKITLEFILKASPTLLYQFFTSPSELVRWFCDDIEVTGETLYIFSWSGYPEPARLTGDIEEELVHFEWLDEDRIGEYLEFKIYQAPVTSETILEITDFCDEDEADEQKALWEAQIKVLKKETGSGN
ncbi:MAG: activator of HSP90 ATPase 1 family protein [Saprospiraceae bacterium]|jgi:uncharacterized protein YndB with AHSA1/START domain|nr:activator of HSP90 ATPase 1 family protein [Saprospiraceae bacterium]